MDEEEKVDLRQADAGGTLAWMIAEEFERAFDELFLELLKEEPKVRKAGYDAAIKPDRMWWCVSLPMRSVETM